MFTWSGAHLSLLVSFSHHKSLPCQVWQKRRYFVFNLSRDLMVRSPHYKSPSCQVWWSQALCKRKDFAFGLSRDLTWLHFQRVMWHYGWFSLVISDYRGKFGDHKRFGRGDIKLSIYHVTSRDHVLRGSRGIISELCPYYKPLPCQVLWP